jgi:hypothetical protein
MISDLLSDSVATLKKGIQEYSGPSYNYDPELISRITKLIDELDKIRIELDAPPTDIFDPE